MKRKMVTGIILAGGRSRRMGSPKGLLPLGNATLIERAVSILTPACSEIIISANTDDDMSFGLRVVKDIIPYGGPMAGIHACLEASQHPVNYVLSCDMPFACKEVFFTLHAALSNHLASVPWYGGDRYEPVCAVYGKEMANRLKGYLSKGITKLPVVFGNEPVTRYDALSLARSYGKEIFYNINTKEDLIMAGKILKNQQEL